MYNTELTENFSRIHRQLISTGFKTDAIQKAIDTNDLFLYQTKILKELQNCHNCKLDCPNKVPGVGNMNSPVMLIGEGPGDKECSTGVPFIGAAGTALVAMMNALGIYRGSVYMTNATHCNIIDPATGKFNTPSIDEIEHCRGFLQAEIAIQNPKIIIAMGNVALWSITMDFGKKISQMRGKVIDINKDIIGINTKVMFTWHPSYVIRQQGSEFEKAKHEMWEDLSFAFSFAKEHCPGYNFNNRPNF